MCGISGFISKRRITLEDLTAMNDTMYHRGPNDSGAEIYDAAGGYAIGFAQRRLSIMDLSPLGHQPMHAADKRVSVVFNGEIYNFQELKKELSGYPFRSQCDTEVILAAYENGASTAFPALTECLRSPCMTGMRRRYILCGTASARSLSITGRTGKIWSLPQS